jgi:hypothetical protein
MIRATSRLQEWRELRGIDSDQAAHRLCLHLRGARHLEPVEMQPSRRRRHFHVCAEVLDISLAGSQLLSVDGDSRRCGLL